MTVDGKMFGTFFDGRLTADGNVKRDKTDKVSKGIETGRFDTSLSSVKLNNNFDKMVGTSCK